MNQSTLRFMIPCLLALFAGSASAQSARGALHAAVPLPPPPPVSASAAAHLSGATAVTAQTGAATSAATSGAAAAGALNAAGQTGAGATAGAPGVNLHATENASATGQANGLSIATQVSGGAASTLDVDATVHTIHQATFGTRETVNADVRTRIEAGEKLMAGLKADAKKAGAQARSDFAKAEIEVRAKEKKLRADLKAAAKTTSESAWSEAQSGLAADYQAYADAVASAETSVHAGESVSSGKS